MNGSLEVRRDGARQPPHRCLPAVWLLLAGLMVFAQAATAAHEVSHGPAPIAGDCLQCLVGHDAKAAAIAVPPFLAAESFRLAPFTPLPDGGASPRATTWSARAPPHSRSSAENR